jgi:hypothetical protein
MKQVLNLSGQSKNVFRYLALLAKHQGHLKLKDIKPINLELP